MNLIGTALAGIYVVVATRSASAGLEGADDSAGAGGEGITCDSGGTKTFAVSKPDTTVTVTFPQTSALESVSEAPKDYIYDAKCNQQVELSNVCPGATVKKEQQGDTPVGAGVKEAPKNGTIVTLRFPQLPASQQVVCVKSPAKLKSDEECRALITVAAASPQGPQACAVGGTSITLEINEAGGSAQFKCGTGRTLAPPEPTKAYAEDCNKLETLKDMTRSGVSDKGYLTVKVEKLKKKKLCYLCQPSASAPRQSGGESNPCNVYVQVNGTTKLSFNVPYGLALPCLAAMLRFT